MSSIALIDFGSLWGLAWHGHGENELNGAQQYAIRRVLGWADHYDHVAICLDSPPYRRRKLYAEYKAQREKRTDLEQEQLKSTLAELRAKGFCLLAHPGEEADDVIASAVAVVPPGHEIDVLSADKDLTTLSSAEVCVISPATNEEIDPVAKWGIKPDKVPHALAMAGDASDNVPGIEGIAAGRAATLLKAGLNVPKLIALVDEAADQAAKTEPDNGRQAQLEIVAARLPPKMGQKIAAGIIDAVVSGTLQRAFELVQLRADLPIDTRAIFAEREPAEPEAPSDEGWDPPAPQQSKPPSAPPSAPEATFEPMPEQVTKSRAASVAAIADRAGSAAMVVSSGEWTRALEPAHLGGAWKLAKALNDAALFRDFGSPSKVLSLILAGRELGIGAMASLRGFHLVEGKPCMSAQLMMGLCLRHPDCVYFKPVHKDCTEQQARVIGRRRSWPGSDGDEWIWDIEEARQAGLSFRTKKGGPGMWTKYPKAMLIWRCVAAAARAWFPDILAGVYTPEELTDGGLMP